MISGIEWGMMVTEEAILRAAGHVAVGSATGFVASMIGMLNVSNEITILGISFVGFVAWLLGTGMGAWGATMPDAFDSSKKLGPNHRRFAHSIVLLAGMCYLIYAILNNQLVMKDRLDVLFVLPFAAGYASHLIVDFPSKKHLPLLF